MKLKWWHFGLYHSTLGFARNTAANRMQPIICNFVWVLDTHESVSSVVLFKIYFQLLWMTVKTNNSAQDTNNVICIQIKF